MKQTEKTEYRNKNVLNTSFGYLWVLKITKPNITLTEKLIHVVYKSDITIILSYYFYIFISNLLYFSRDLFKHCCWKVFNVTRYLNTYS